MTNPRHPNCIFCFEEIWYYIHLQNAPTHCKKPECIEKCNLCINEQNQGKESVPDGAWIIRLSDEDYEDATNIGMQRYYHAKKSNLTCRYGQQEYNPEYHTRGARGESAAAKRLGLQWINPLLNREGKGRYKDFKKATDLPQNIEVRTVEKYHHRLIIHPDDVYHARFILVVEDGRFHFLRGWIYAHEGMKEEYLESYQGYEMSHFVPNLALRSMDSLQLEKSPGQNG